METITVTRDAARGEIPWSTCFHASPLLVSLAGNRVAISTAEIIPADVGSTDANNAIALGIPAVAVGAVVEHLPPRLEEFAEASSIVPGIKSLVAIAVALATH